MSYNPGTILHIQNFVFKDGEIKDTGKYIIILSEQDKTSLIISITTSRDSIPDNLKSKKCIHEESSRLHAYWFKENEPICENDYFFPKPTYIYLTGAHIQEYGISRLESESKEGKITFKGVLKHDELLELVYCVYKSPMIKRKFKPILEALIKELTKES